MKKALLILCLLLSLCLLCACNEDTAPEDAHTHEWGEWIETTAPTCTSRGIQTRVCACGESETQYVEIVGHEPADGWSTDGTNHWKTCLRTGCDGRFDEAAHVYDAADTCVCQHYNGPLQFALEDGTYTVIGLNSLDTSVVIPSQYKGIAVTSISPDAFRSSCVSLTSIFIPASVTRISDHEFSSSADTLESITVESENTAYRSEGNCLITANNLLLSGCKNSVIPTSVTSIGSHAFSGCTGLMSVTIPDSVKSIGEGAFRNCTGLMSVTIGNGVTSIGAEVFKGCTALTSVTIGNDVTSIGSYAFYDCTSLTSITIPDGVTSIGNYAFSGCNLTTVTCNTTGWRVSTDANAASGTVAELTASNLTVVYGYYYWKRG